MGRLGPLNSNHVLDLREYLSSKRKLCSNEITDISPSQCGQVGCKLVTIHYVQCFFRSIPTTLHDGSNDYTPHRRSVFDRLSNTSKRRKSLKKNSSKVPELSADTVNMTSSGEGKQRRPRRRRHKVALTPTNSSDSDYSPGLSQIWLNQDGTFRGTRSRVAIPFNYGPSFLGSSLSGPLRNMFQWSDAEEEASGYASSSTVNSI